MSILNQKDSLILDERVFLVKNENYLISLIFIAPQIITTKSAMIIILKGIIPNVSAFPSEITIVRQII